MPLLLELFSGTGSIGTAFRQVGWEVFAVDLDARTEADLHIDVMNLTPSMLPPHIDAIWASPPCTQHSRARTTAKTPRDLIGSDALVQKVLDLVAHYKVPFFFENPHSGLLKSRAVVAGIPMQVVDYCRYGKQYRKRTAIWTDTAWVPQRPLCKFDCVSSSGLKRHAEVDQRGGRGKNDTRRSQNELYSIPAELCSEIAEFMDAQVRLPEIR